MGHLLANNPGQQDAGEILLSGFTHMALQMEAQRRLVMKPSSKPRRGKKGPKKQPQRGLGVAQLEKIRLEEQRRASQHAQHLAALRQLRAGPPLFSSSNAGMQAPASIIPQLEKESSNHASSLTLHTNPGMTSSLAHFPCIDGIASSFLLSSIPPLGSSGRPSAPAAPLDLFPVEKLVTTSSKRSDSILADNNWPLPRVLRDNRHYLDNSDHSSLNLVCEQGTEIHDHGNINYSPLHLRQSFAQTIRELRNSETLNQMPALDRRVELSSFQIVSASSRSNQLVMPNGLRAWGAVQKPGGLLSELPMWTIPSYARNKASDENEVRCRRSVDEECELTLRLPGSMNVQQEQRLKLSMKAPTSSAPECKPHNFLALSVGGTTCMWQESVADAASSTPSPANTTTKTTSTTSTSTTDEHSSSLATSISYHTNFLCNRSYLSNDSQNSPNSSFDANLDLTLKL